MRGACAAWAIAVLVATTVARAADVTPVRREEYLAVEDARLYVETRGDDSGAPILVWLHGGPGGAERPLFRYFDGALERDFAVVYFDQRGAGRSFDPDADPHALTIARHVADLDAVVAHLRRTLGRDAVALLGHSWGAFLALRYAAKHPAAVRAVVAVNPLVSALRAQQSQYEFVRGEVARRSDAEAERRLAMLGPPPYAKAADLLAVDALAERYGAVFHRPPNRFTTVVGGLFRGLVTPWEIPRFVRGNTVSLDAMTSELLAVDLADALPRVAVPVAVFVGRYDRHVDAAIASAYFDALDAPAKTLVEFEDSAHNVPFEEPARFVAEVRRVLGADPRRE